MTSVLYGLCSLAAVAFVGSIVWVAYVDWRGRRNG